MTTRLVRGSIQSWKPCSISKAAHILRDFVEIDGAADPSVMKYLKGAAKDLERSRKMTKNRGTISHGYAEVDSEGPSLQEPGSRHKKKRRRASSADFVDEEQENETVKHNIGYPRNSAIFSGNDDATNSIEDGDHGLVLENDSELEHKRERKKTKKKKDKKRKRQEDVQGEACESSYQVTLTQRVTEAREVETQEERPKKKKKRDKTHKGDAV